jgi:chromosome segregation ATPase
VKAQEDAKERQAKREAEDKAKADKKEKDFQDAVGKLQADINEYSGEADKFAKEAADLEIQLTKLRSRKEQATREAFELAKQVELAKVNRRNAELEIQRMVDMVAQKLNSSPLSAPPPPPPPAPAR